MTALEAIAAAVPLSLLGAFAVLFIQDIRRVQTRSRHQHDPDRCHDCCGVHEPGSHAMEACPACSGKRDQGREELHGDEHQPQVPGRGPHLHDRPHGSAIEVPGKQKQRDCGSERRTSDGADGHASNPSHL